MWPGIMSVPIAVFFLGIFVWSQSGDHLSEDVEKGTIIPKKI